MDNNKHVPAVFGKTFQIQKSEEADIYLFEGIATVEGTVDKSGERFERGAFSESIGKTVPIQIMHGGIWTIIGTGVISKSGDTIYIKGRLFDDVEAARAIAKSKAAGVQFNLSIGGRRIEYSWVRENDELILSTKKATITEVSFTGEGQQAHPEAVVTKTNNKEDNKVDNLDVVVKMLNTIAEKIEKALTAGEEGAADPAFAKTITQELEGLKKTVEGIKVPEDVVKTAELEGLKTLVSNLEKSMNALQMPKTGGESGVEKSLQDDREAINKFIRDAHGDFRKAGEELEKYGAEYVKTLTTETSSAGYTIPKAMEKEIIKELSDSNPMYTDAKIYEGMAKTLSVPVRVKGTNTAESVAEGSAGNDGTITYTNLELEAGIIQSQVPITDECREDSAFDLSAEISEVVTEDFADTLATRIVKGVVSTTQKFEGFTVNAEVVANAVDTENSGELAHEDLVNLEMAVKKRDRKGAKYYASTQAVTAMKKFRDSASKPFWYESVDKSVPPTYNGYPVEEIAEMDDVAAGKYPVLFANFKEFYAILRRKGMTMEVDRDSKKRVDTVITNARLGGKVRRSSCGKLLKIKA